MTLGAGGAFQSGSAELTPDAKALIAKLSKDAIDQNSSLTITGTQIMCRLLTLNIQTIGNLPLPEHPVSPGLSKTQVSSEGTE